MIPRYCAARVSRLVLIAALLTACIADGEQAPGPTAEGVSREGLLIGSLVREQRLRLACGSARSARLKHAFVLTARECLTCLDVAPALREFMREDTIAAASLGIVTTEPDTLEVCEYLKREKVQVPVFSAREFSRSPEAPPVIRYLVFDRSGNVSREEHSAIPANLLDRIGR